MAHAAHGGDLARGAIGLREVLFQSVTSMAPAGAVALSIAAGAGYAGGALPLAVVLALVGCLLVASSIGQLAKHLPSAGSVYTYPAEAIHPAIGFLAGWGYSLVETLTGPTTMVVLGYLFGAVFHSEWNWPFTTTWVGFTCACAVIVAILNYRGIRVSARTGTGVIILIYMVFNLSCLLYYLRRRRSEFKIVLHAVIPVLGIVAFIPAWFVLGVLVLVYLCIRHPERLPLTRRVFADEPVATEEQRVTT